jgi:hypothetical protein
MKIYGRVPWRSPPSKTVKAGQEIAGRPLEVKQIWIVFHDDLYLVQGAKHVWCRFHHQRGVTHWLTQHFATAEEINTRERVMKKVFQT